jgi:hypothetical protein
VKLFVWCVLRTQRFEVLNLLIFAFIEVRFSNSTQTLPP